MEFALVTYCAEELTQENQFAGPSEGNAVARRAGPMRLYCWGFGHIFVGMIGCALPATGGGLQSAWPWRIFVAVQ